MTVRMLGIIMALLLPFAGCSPDSETEAGPSGRLLVLCGITMIDPVKELMTRFERDTGVKMNMSYGGSADLMQSIVLDKTGDIYFPGSQNYIEEADRLGLINESRQLGINQAALFVRKGNPRGLTGDLDELLRPGLQVAIGHPDLGSIGKEAQNILKAKGIYDQVAAGAAMMALDSKSLTRALIEGKVDVVLNWKAVLHIGDNRDRMDVLPIQGGFAAEHKLTMAVVRYSGDHDMSLKFLNLCASPEGRAVFARYGF